MKTFNNKFICVTFLCTVFCFSWSTQDKLRIRIPTPMVLILRQEAERCAKEFGVPASNLRKIIDKTLPNDEPNNNFFFCLTTGGQVVDEKGHFVVEKMAAFQVVDGTPEDYANSVKECNKNVKANAIETLLATADCLHENYQFAPAAQQ